jgi:hypothetical protein
VPWIATCFLVGTLLVFAPWVSFWGYSPWESNWLLQAWPSLRALLLSSFTRGAVTGLGLVNVLLALHDTFVRLAAPRDGDDGTDGQRGLRGLEE